MTEQTNQPELSAQDKADLAALGVPAEEVTERTLLVLWADVLSNAEANADEPIPVGVASKTVASWPFLTFQETAIYHRLYHQVLGECYVELQEVIRDNPDALGWTGHDDGRENHKLYRELLVRWHMILDDHESAWRAEDEDSHIWVAVIADARAFFFSQMGLAGHLDVIGFSLTDGEFMDALQRAREEIGE